MLYKKNQKVKQKENLPEEVSVMFEMPGKLKAGARQDSKTGSHRRNYRTAKVKAGMCSISGKCDIWKKKRITYPASRMRIYL